jgi:hypothetical protein
MRRIREDDRAVGQLPFSEFGRGLSRGLGSEQERSTTLVDAHDYEAGGTVSADDRSTDAEKLSARRRGPEFLNGLGSAALLPAASEPMKLANARRRRAGNDPEEGGGGGKREQRTHEMASSGGIAANLSVAASPALEKGDAQ